MSSSAVSIFNTKSTEYSKELGSTSDLYRQFSAVLNSEMQLIQNTNIDLTKIIARIIILLPHFCSSLLLKQKIKNKKENEQRIKEIENNYEKILYWNDLRLKYKRKIRKIKKKIEKIETKKSNNKQKKGKEKERKKKKIKKKK
jgi:TolA-binding protein